MDQDLAKGDCPSCSLHDDLKDTVTALRSNRSASGEKVTEQQTQYPVHEFAQERKKM